MKTIRQEISVILVLILCSCNHVHQQQVETLLSENDKNNIEHAFVNNVEALRRVLSYNKNGWNYKKAYDSIPDFLPRYSAGCFILYAVYSGTKYRQYALRQPACEYLDVNVEQLHYSADSLKCVALVTIGYEKHFVERGIENGNEYVYDGIPIIGIRNSKIDNFKIYPMEVTTFHGFPSRKQVKQLLGRTYYNNLKGNTPANGNGHYYSCGINNPEFFETAYEFSWIDSLNLYWGETYMVPGGRRVPYRFYSNQDSTINKNLCE